jgi:hypothetical protein
MKDLKIYLSVAAFLLVVYVTAQYNRPTGLDWSQRLYNTDKSPFGTYILYHQIKDIFPNASVKTVRQTVYNVLKNNDSAKSTYVIISNKIDLNNNDYQKLLQFIKKGNDVFIASVSFGKMFKRLYKIETRTEFGSTDVELVNKNLDTTWIEKSKRELSSNYFHGFDTTRFTVLGKNNFDDVNFLKCRIGKGNLYLNANPLLYTNYALANPGSLYYAETSLSYLKMTDNVIWDEYYTKGDVGSDNPLRVFLEHPQLKWALYIAYITLVIFVVFHIKRRQRVIPVIEPLQNATLDFVKVVGQVYYEQRDNANLVQKKIIYFLDHLRTQYYIKTSKLDNEFITDLVNKTGADASLARELANHINYLNQQTKVTDDELITLNKLIEKFNAQA